MSTINDLNTTLQNKIYLDEENIISTPLKKGNSGILNNKEIPSIEETVKHLQYNYEVLEIRQDYQGTLENLMRQQGKKIPKYLPFINLFLVGGGSSGGWIQGHGSGYWGNTNFYYLNNIDLKTNINIKIGKGGASKPKIMQSPLLNDDDYLPNLGDTTEFSYNNGNFKTSKPIFRDVSSYKIDTPIAYEPRYYDYRDFVVNTTINIDIDSYIKRKNCNLKTDSSIYIPHNYNYINSPALIFSMSSTKEQDESGGPIIEVQSYYSYPNILSNDIDIYKKYLNKIKENFEKRPGIAYKSETYSWDFKINDYGATSNFNPSNYITAYGSDVVFFDGMDINDIGMPGLSGSKAKYIVNMNNEGKKTFNYQRGYCGKGGDGACFIYYPKEV